MSREILAREALAHIPKLLTLLDRNHHSATYGCFDRNFWHYKIIDFPSGMAQEFVWPLALVYDTRIEGNLYYQSEAIRDWVEAGIRFASLNMHSNGSCDDYFPYEQAAGASVFSLLACLESYDLLRFDDPDLEQFMTKRADWLAEHEESGRLTNHHALTVLAFERLGRMLNTNRWDSQRDRRLHRILQWQDPEGWFPEYEGFDPGYHTLTISSLARLDELRGGSDELRHAISKAVKLAYEVVHPDGSFGGEYGSRNTYNFFPHGFELAGRWLPEALIINDRVLKGVGAGLNACFADDHIIGHHLWNYLLAWRSYVEFRPPTRPRTTARIMLKNAGIIIDRRDNTELYAALNKGCVFKFFRNGQLVASDTQLSVQVGKGKHLRTAVGHLIGDYEAHVERDTITTSGRLGWAKNKAMTPFRLVVLRALMLSIGRFFPNLIRRLLQKMLITGKTDSPFTFKRTLEWKGDQLHVVDEIKSDSRCSITAIGIACDQTSTYTAMSRTFQRSHLAQWKDLTDPAATAGSVKVERTL
jgi:hypothetical protein